MKKYKKRIPLLSPNSTLVVALCLLCISCLLIKMRMFEELAFVMLGIMCSLIFISILSLLSTIHAYTYTQNSINFWYMGVKYHKIEYQCIKSIIISNAVYNDSKYDGNVFDYPLYFYEKGDIKKRKKQYPYITLSTQNDISYDIKEGMNNRRIYYLDTKNLFNLGICWFDSLCELLFFTEAQVYILEDVYDRFKEEFDKIIFNNNVERKRIIIISTPQFAVK